MKTLDKKNTMNNTLNMTLAIARQQFDELLRLVSIDELRDFKLGEKIKRNRIKELLESLNKALATIEVELRTETDIPVTQIGASHIKFFREYLEPNTTILRRAYWECIGLRDLFESIDDYQPQHSNHPVREAIAWGLGRWRDMLDDDELEDWNSRGFAIDSALETVMLPWFTPDSWRENMTMLRPVLLDRSPQQVPFHVRHRLMEIYRAFMFGLWMSSIALCRSLLEYSLKETAPKWDIERTKSDCRGEQVDKSMKDLCNEFSTHFPALSDSLEQVRSDGNRIMHAKKGNVTEYPKILRKEALNCIRSMRHSLETIYARNSG